MYLNAITIGYAVPSENFTASVHSVFQSAINLQLYDSDKLLTLLASGEMDLPQGIRLDTPKDYTFEIFSVGEQVTCQDNVLRLDSLTVDLRSARRWRCDLPILKADTTKPAVSAAWNCVWEALNKRQILSKAEIVAEYLFRSDEIKSTSISRKAGKSMQNLVKATRRYDSTNTSVVNSLIGLGSGLTPSGDDLLIGYMTGLWCTVQGRRERVQFVSDMGETIIRRSSKTNDISRTYLYHATQGQVSIRLANLAEAIGRGENPDRLLEAAEAAMRVGHTSGMDVVTGLLVGFAAWEGNHILSF